MSVVFPLLPFLLGKYLPDSQIVIGMSALVSAYAVCTFFAAPIFGALSDRYGRKSILIISLLGSVAGWILFGIGGALWVLFLGRIIDGLTAGNISTMFAYIADSTEPKERTKWYSYIGATIGIGFMIGPAL
jgi:DHA1 family tetracycline resistance protein-like MFS transporter